MNTSHTPGPWTLSDECDPLVSAPDGQYIAQVFAYGRDANDCFHLRRNYAADAALVIAAPYLLAALRQIAEEASNNYPDALARIGEIAAAAVSSATGEAGFVQTEFHRECA